MDSHNLTPLTGLAHNESKPRPSAGANILRASGVNSFYDERIRPMPVASVTIATRNAPA